jgi:uncharacterized protein YndB with AHSA1/START domain
VKTGTEKPTYVYVTYIKTTAEKLWQALTDGEITRQYWSGQRNTSDWKVGSTWQHGVTAEPSAADIVGTVVESERPRRLVVTWAAPSEANDPARVSRVTFDVAEDQGLVRLRVTHDNLEPDSDMARGIDDGWPGVLAGLKTYLETGQPLPPIVERDDTNNWQRIRFA